MTRVTRSDERATPSSPHLGGGREEALTMAERLREEISRMSVVTAGGGLSLTISLGVAALSPDGEETLESLIDRADQAMYRAKAAGRNAVSV